MRGCIVVAALFVLTAVQAGAGTACALHAGTRVVLRSSDFNPDVFVWDSEARMINYAQRVPYVTSEEVFRHAVLAKAGTQAVLVACHTDGVRPRFSDALEDAVRVRIVTGVQRGRQGWISSGDLRRGN